jgi:tRNA A37 threonylcarbamoyladenosine synthetase subunit TsaC/SUA5/YrdC
MLKPEPGAPALIDYEGDAQRIFDVVADGGTAIMPVTTGYALLGASRDSVMGIFNNKQRAPSKVTALCGSLEVFEAVQVVGAEQRRVIDSITQFFRLPLGVIAPVRLDHPLFEGVHEDILAQSRRDGTVMTLINGGALADGVAHLSLKHNIAMFGSSANVSTKGTRFRLEDIEPEIRALADIEIDYGPVLWNAYGKSSTIIDFRNYTLVREGIACDLIEYILKKHFSITLKRPAPAA